MRGPEAGDGEEVVADGHEEVVLVGHVRAVVAEEERATGPANIIFATIDQQY